MTAVPDDARAPASAEELAWELAVDAAGVGAFDWDLATGDLRWDERLLALFGLDHATFGGTIEAFNRRVHPDDLPRVSAALDAAIAGCGTYTAEYRVLLPDGSVRWISARGRALAGPDGAAARLLGAAHDTTAEQDAEARVARVLETMPTAFFQLDRGWRFSYLNRESEQVLGTQRADLLGRTVWEAFPAAVGSEFERQYRHAVASGEPVAFDAHYPAPLDAWYEVHAWPNPDGLAVYFVDVTERYRAAERVAVTTRRESLLAEVTERLVGTLDRGEAVARIGALVVPELADWCVATLLLEDGGGDRGSSLRDVGGWHHDPDLQPVVERYAEVRLAQLVDSSFLPALLEQTEPVVVPTGGREALSHVFAAGEVHDLTARLDPESVVVVVLRGRDRVLGMLTAVRSSARGPFSEDDVETLAEVASRAGLALDNARLFAEQRALAEGLQRSLLSEPPQPDHLEIAVRYEAAAEAAQVGGDWYDAFLQPAGDTMLVIGDVVGHDTAAAAAMGQVRSMLRGIAVHGGEGPAEVLRGVDRALETLQVDTTATAVVARLEQTPGELEDGVTRLRWSNAGHPPPVLVGADGRGVVLDGSRAALERTHAADPVAGLDPLGAPTDLLLGLDPDTERREHEVVLERGAIVLLYTDGLVERRDEALDAGLRRLVTELETLVADGLPLEHLCERLLQRLRPERHDDDVALVAVRLHPQFEPRPAEAADPHVPAAVDPDAPGAAGRHLTLTLPALTSSVPEARRFVGAAVRARFTDALAEDAELCVTELVTNAVVHAAGESVEVTVEVEPDGVVVSVADDGDAPVEGLSPRLHLDEGVDGADAEATSGRGLAIVAVLATDWGVRRTPSGNRVWARLVADGDHAVRPPDLG